MKKLKPTDYELLSELIENPKLSDRQIAKKMGVSQPTITRKRRELEQERLLDYTSIPDLAKLGFEILAITFGNRAARPPSELQIRKAKDFIERHPNLIFVSSGIGVNSDRIAISIHKDYSDYSEFNQEIRREWGEIMTLTGSFVISLASDSILRHLTFKYLAELMKNEHAQKKT